MGIAKVILDSILGLGRFSWSGLKATSYMSYSLTKNTIKGTSSIAKKIARRTGITTKRYAKPIYNIGSALYPIGEFGMTIVAPIVGIQLLSGFMTKNVKNYIENQNEKIRNFKEKSARLEFNDYLNTGYFTFKASTERQRAQNLLDQSNFSGRELLGTEAEHYA